MPPIISRAANNIPARTNSFTPFAFAPGVLKTTTPWLANFSKGILFTPTPALAIATTRLGIFNSCIEALRTRMASALFMSSTI